jgi:hypothetical protein
MLGDIGVAGLLHKSGSRSLADGALCRDLAFSNITTNGANVLLHKNRPPSFFLYQLENRLGGVGTHRPLSWLYYSE